MKYKKLTDERKEYIDSLAEKLRQNYYSNSKIDFQSLVKDKDIAFLKTEKMIGAMAVGAMINGNEKNYIFIGSYYASPSVEEFDKFHEVGHILLKHTRSLSGRAREREANYFAEKITGKRSIVNEYLDAFQQVLMHPIKAAQFATHSMKNFFMESISELEAKAQEKS